MKSFTNITNSLNKYCFNIHMNIFSFLIKIYLSLRNIIKNFKKSIFNKFRVIFRNNPLLPKHFGMGNTSKDILFIHSLVKRNRRMKMICKTISRLSKSSTPKFHYLSPLCCFIIARTFEGRPKRLIKPSASRWL